LPSFSPFASLPLLQCSPSIRLILEHALDLQQPILLSQQALALQLVVNAAMDSATKSVAPLLPLQPNQAISQLD
jgi:hypothetical protein